MTYEIQSKSDFLTGASLTVRIPEDDLDKKALYTISADKPDFLLPFRHRRIDGQIEFVYQIGPNSKLQYLSGGRSPKEYAQLWSGVLRPLLDCGDWFMKPYSFVLDAGYLYCDKNRKTVGYVYIPSVRDCSNYDALKEMAAEISKTVTVADAELENKVLRAIMKDFNPNDFLQMLKSYIEASIPAVRTRPAQEPWPTLAQADEPTGRPEPQVFARADEVREPDPGQRIQADHDGRPQETVHNVPGDIIINIPSDRVSEKKIMQHPKNKETTGGKKEKATKKVKSAGGLFGSKKSVQREEDPGITALPMPPGEPARPVPEMSTAAADVCDDTQSVPEASGGAGLRLIGSALLPPLIDIPIGEGEVFTVGRYDAAAGKKLSSFEFDKKTKAVSRRHAVFERDASGYSIVDLSSSAGTFVDGLKIPPNTPFELKKGSRISFGNAGADYVWEG